MRQRVSCAKVAGDFESCECAAERTAECRRAGTTDVIVTIGAPGLTIYTVVRHAWKRRSRTMVTMTLRYARYALSALASVGFGLVRN